MDVKRRDFVKGCAATSVLLLADLGSAANASSAPASDIDPAIEKSIKASFGGGFVVKAHGRSGGLTYADIEHFGNRYRVFSADMMDWTLVPSSLRNSSFASSSII